MEKYGESRIQKFQPTRKKEFLSVKFDEEKKEMICIVYRKYPTVAVKANRLYVGINGQVENKKTFFALLCTLQTSKQTFTI